MSVFRRISKKELVENFDHYGFMYGIVPAYVGDLYGDTRIAVRNWCPEVVLDIMTVVFDVSASIIQSVSPEYVPMHMVKITGKMYK